MSANTVQVIQATRKAAGAESSPAILRVGCYARVSTDNVEQKTSYAAQISEYTERINKNPQWTMVDIYADEGLSGTSAAKRKDFQRLLQDCRAGLIDLVLCKSISRFARNVEECIHIVKELRAINVDVFFEKENIHSIDPSSDVIFTILAVFAQQESESISKNVMWGLRKKMKDGGLVGGSSQILGFDYENGNYVINEEQADTVRYIYRLYLGGKGFRSIAHILESEEYLTAKGTAKWDDSTIQGILSNEKYYGALLSQKTVGKDFLTHTRKLNEGDADQYYVENHHPAIISKETFELVQKERARRAVIANGENPDRSQFTVRYAFSEHLVCAHCGDTLKRVHRSYGVGWQCRRKLHGEKVCDAKTVHNTTLERAFIDVYNEINSDKAAFFNGFLRSIERVVSRREQDVDVTFLENQRKELDKQMKELIRMKLRKDIDEAFYNQTYQEIKTEIREVQERLERFSDSALAAADHDNKMENIRKAIHTRTNLLDSFDEELFRVLVEKVIVHSPVDFTFVLANGTERRFDASAYKVADGRGKHGHQRKKKV